MIWPEVKKTQTAEILLEVGFEPRAPKPTVTWLPVDQSGLQESEFYDSHSPF